MSPEQEPNTEVLEQKAQVTGAERADGLIDDHLNRAGTVGEVRSKVRHILTEVQGDKEAEERVHDYESALTEAAANHDSVSLEKMSGGQQGENRVGTHDSKANTDLFQSDALIEDTENAAEVLDHEDEEATGHAGQMQGRQGLVQANGDVVEGSELYEGEVEAQQSVKHRGSAHSARAGQPAEVYGTGQNLVAPKLSVYSDYLRRGTDQITAQAEVLRGQNREQILVTLSQSGRYTKEEIMDVARQAA